MKINIRNKVVTVHRWAGLTVGSVILMMALTGISNLFRPQLELVINEDLLTVPACTARESLVRIVESARASHSAGELDYVNIENSVPGAARIPAVRVRFADPQEDVFVNPCTATVLGERPRYGGILGRIEQLHIFRVSEEPWVRSLTGVFALLFAVLIIGGGFYLWWPRNIGLKRALTLSTPLQNKARTIHRHKTFGVYASLVLLSMVLTGLPLSFGWYKEGIYALTGSLPMPKIPKSVVQAGAPRISIEDFWKQAQVLSPDLTRALLKFPNKRADAPMEGFLIARNAPHVNARDMIYVDAYSGKVLKHIPYESNSLGHKLYFWTISYHTGQVGGLFMKLIMLLGVLTVPYMAYTGWGMYLARRRKQPAVEAVLSAK